jgi:hypothetical protein
MAIVRRTMENIRRMKPRVNRAKKWHAPRYIPASILPKS